VSVCDFWRQQAQAKYNEALLEAPKDEDGRRAVARRRRFAKCGAADSGGEDVDDDLYQDAVRICCEMGGRRLRRCSGDCALDMGARRI